MATKRVPQSAEFAFDSAIRSLNEQLSRIDALDAKAGILLAADGILAGLIFGRDAYVGRAPWWVALAAGAGVLASLACALRAAANRNYKLAPDPGRLAQLAQAPPDWIRWRLIGNVLDAADKNRAKLRQKSRWLTAGQVLLLVTLVPLGAYFAYSLLKEAA